MVSVVLRRFLLFFCQLLGDLDLLDTSLKPSVDQGISCFNHTCVLVVYLVDEAPNVYGILEGVRVLYARKSQLGVLVLICGGTSRVVAVDTSSLLHVAGKRSLLTRNSFL